MIPSKIESISLWVRCDSDPGFTGIASKISGAGRELIDLSLVPQEKRHEYLTKVRHSAIQLAMSLNPQTENYAYFDFELNEPGAMQGTPGTDHSSSASNRNPRILHEEPREIGGHQVCTSLPKHYVGPAAIRAIGSDDFFAVFKDIDNAIAAASYAVTPDGGHCDIEITAARPEEVTFDTWEDWAFK